MNEFDWRYRKRIAIEKPFDRFMPELLLIKYGCEGCDEFTAPANLPYFKAIARHGDHNKLKHATGPAPKITMIYRI